jgi:dockerin type I repeat protein
VHRTDVSKFLLEALELRTLLAAPVILSERFNTDGTPSLIAQFSTDVSANLTAGSLVFQDQNAFTTFQVTADAKNQIVLSYNTSTNTATFTFPKYTKALPDSNYRAILYGERVLDASGTPMATDSTFDFSVYNGDVNGDRHVNALDFNTLASNFGKTAQVYSQGDLDLNGTVNTADFTKLASRFGTSFAAAPPPPRRMDVVTFNNNTDGSDRYTSSMFAVHNTPEPGGYLFMMGSDAHRLELSAQGNTLGTYYNSFNSDQQIADPNIMIQRIQASWCVKMFTSVGSGLTPTWISLNEISASLWPSSQQYRDWVKTVAHTLHVTYGHEVIIFSPFANPNANSADWKALSKDAYIGVENYLSGYEMESHGFSVSWAKSQYQTSISAYGGLGVPGSRLIETEEYSMTNGPDSGYPITGYGRDGVSYADWDTTIATRAQALHELGQYFGDCGYAWGKNAMLDTEADQIHFIQTFRAQQLR